MNDTLATWVRRHAIARALERFGVALSVEEYDSLSADVAARLKRPDGYSASGRLVFQVNLDCFVAYAGWHDHVSQIGTFHRGDACRIKRVR